MTSVKLPKWLQDVLPMEKLPAVLSLENGSYVVTHNESQKVFSNLIDVDTYLIKEDLDVRFHESIETSGLGVLAFPTENNDGSSYMIIETSDGDRYGRLVEQYESFLRVAQAYEENPTDFVHAWQFIDTHPAFWTIFNHATIGEAWLWNTSGHASHLRSWIRRSETTGDPVVTLETGSTVRKGEPDQAFKTHYGDWRLEVSAPTYEEAIIELASRLALTHDLEGNSREVSESILPKPAWVKNLEERTHKLSRAEDSMAIDTESISQPDEEQKI